MTAFEFIFPLFGLLVGLTYTEMLAGLARALKSRRRVKIGWLVPLLGVLILINLTMFWFGAWQMRHVAIPTSGTLLMTLLIGGTYYLMASAFVRHRAMIAALLLLMISFHGLSVILER